MMSTMTLVFLSLAQRAVDGALAESAGAGWASNGTLCKPIQELVWK